MSPGNPLDLTGTASASLASINANSPPVIQSPANTSYLVTCPTDFPTGTATGLCFGASGHPGGHKFDVGSKEYNVILQWITDGHMP